LEKFNLGAVNLYFAAKIQRIASLTSPENTESVGVMLKNVISDQTTRNDMAAVRQAARRRRRGETRHRQYHSTVGL
jgi:uncharacterized protein YaiE (UPF0345 family)